jgi:hypothetical protein
MVLEEFNQPLPMRAFPIPDLKEGGNSEIRSWSRELDPLGYSLLPLPDHSEPLRSLSLVEQKRGGSGE